MLKFDFVSGTFQPATLQQDTSMTSIFKNGLEAPSGSPVFSDTDMVHVYRDFDVLNQSLDPLEIARQKEIDAVAESQSQVNVQNTIPDA